MIIIMKKLTGLGAQAFLHRHSFDLSLHTGGNLEMAAAILLLAFPDLVAGFFAADFFLFA